MSWTPTSIDAVPNLPYGVRQRRSNEDEENRRKAAMFDLIVGNKVSVSWHNGLSINYPDKSGKIHFQPCDSIRAGLMKAIAEGHIR